MVKIVKNDFSFDSDMFYFCHRRIVSAAVFLFEMCLLLKASEMYPVYQYMMWRALYCKLYKAILSV